MDVPYNEYKNELSSNDKYLPQIYNEMGGPYPDESYYLDELIGMPFVFVVNPDDEYNILHDERWLGYARNYLNRRLEEKTSCPFCDYFEIGYTEYTEYILKLKKRA